MRNPFQKARAQDGAAAVEFAIIVGVLVMLIFGMLQFGLAFFELQTLRSAVREGARIGAVGADDEAVRQRVSDMTANQVPDSASVITISRGDCDEDIEAEIAVSIDAQDPDLPASVQDIFSLDIPFMSPIEISAPIEGTFRCEVAVP